MSRRGFGGHACPRGARGVPCRCTGPLKGEPVVGAFLIHLDNQPGQLAGVLEAVAGQQANVMLCATTYNEWGVICLVSDDETSVRGALADAGASYTERDSLLVRLPNRPGTGASLARALADAGVNIEAFLPVSISGAEARAVLVVDDLPAAQLAAADVLVES